jgi:hypothetical protein
MVVGVGAARWYYRGIAGINERVGEAVDCSK